MKPSCATTKLTDATGRKTVIRRPPLGELLPKAHDMAREWAVISALSKTRVPVPAAYGFCDDISVTGARFYVMGHIDGRPLYNAADTLRAALLGTYDHMANGLPGYLTREAMREDPRQTTSPDDEAETDTYNANLALRWFATPDQEVNTALIVNRREAASDFHSWMSFTETVVDSLTFTLNHKLDGTLLARPARLLSGVDLYLDRLEADRFADAATSIRLLNATVDKGSFGAFINGETDLADKLTLALGGRVELARYAADVATPDGQTR